MNDPEGTLGHIWCPASRTECTAKNEAPGHKGRANGPYAFVGTPSTYGAADCGRPRPGSSTSRCLASRSTIVSSCIPCAV